MVIAKCRRQTLQLRYKKQTGNETSYYIDKSYEKTIKDGNIVEDKYFIYVGSKVMSIYTNSTNTPSTKYLHYDSLNSVDTITNNLGVVESRMAYKPFGEKLNLDKEGNPTTKASHTNRGYTGHEHIQETNLINMNARLYDPTIARFISADSIIPYMYDTQSFNRYSYVRNNPLKYIDPSGHWGFSSISSAWKSLGSSISQAAKDTGSGLSTTWKDTGASIAYNKVAIVTVIVVIVVTFVTWGIGTVIFGAGAVAAGTAGGVAMGAVAGAAGGFAGGMAGTLYAGGTMSQAWSNGRKGAITGAIMGAIGGGFGSTWNMGRVMAQSMGGGVSSELTGGSFEDGFKVALVTSVMAYAYNSTVEYDATWESGGDAVKKHPLTMPKSTDNNFGIATFKELGNRGFWEEGGTLSRIANQIPGMNALAGFHDVLQVGLDYLQGPGVQDGWMRTAFNVPAMVPATIVSYGALASDIVPIYVATDEFRDLK